METKTIEIPYSMIPFDVKNIKDVHWFSGQIIPKYEKIIMAEPVKDGAPYEFVTIHIGEHYDDKRYKRWCYLDDLIQTNIKEDSNGKED